MGIDTYRITPDEYIICTSATRPAQPFNGMMIYETDTERLYVYNGSAWKYKGGGTDPIRARAYRNAAFTLTVGSAPILAFDTEWWDDSNAFDVATGRYTCPEVADYRVDFHCSVNGAVSGERFLCFAAKNGNEDIRGTDILATATGRVTLEVHGIITAASVGDILDIRVNQVNGTARGLDVGSSGTLCWVEISRA